MHPDNARILALSQHFEDHNHPFLREVLTVRGPTMTAEELLPFVVHGWKVAMATECERRVIGGHFLLRAMRATFLKSGG